MSRRDFLAFLFSGLLVIGLAGCTSFSPVYSDGAATGLAAARFNFAPPTSRLEQVVLNRLSLAFPAQGGPGDPVLRVSVSSTSPGEALSNAMAVGAPVNVRVNATVSIVQDGATLFSASRFADTSYQGGKLAPTNQASAEGARDVAAQSAAEALRAAIMAGYRPGLVSTQPR